MRFPALLLLLFAAFLFTATPMAAYCTAADVEAKYDQATLAQRTGDATGAVIDAEKLQRAIDDYAAEMVPHVRARYEDHDFGTANPTLNALNVEGAYLELAKRRPGGLVESELAALRRLDVRLNLIATGAIDLGVDPLEPAPLVVEDLFRSNPRIMGRDPGLHTRTDL